MCTVGQTFSPPSLINFVSIIWKLDGCSYHYLQFLSHWTYNFTGTLSHGTRDYIKCWICIILIYLGFRPSISCGPKSVMVHISLHWVGLKWLKCDRIPKRPNRVLVVSNVHDVLDGVLRLYNYKYNMFLLKKV